MVFDMDGILLDTERICHRLLMQAFSEIGVRVSHEEYVSMIGLNSRAVNARLKNLLPNDLDIDAFVIGTIYKSNSHPNGPTLGIEKFMELVRLSKKPVIGIGGINLQNIDAIKKSNAIGVAMISELANTNNLEKTINKLKSYYD